MPREKAVESVRELLLSARSHAVRQGHVTGLPAGARQLGRESGHRYRTDGLGGAEVGDPALQLFRPGRCRRPCHHVFHRHRHARNHQAEDPRSGRVPRAEDQGGAGHRRGHHRGRAERDRQAAARGRQRGLEEQGRGGPKNQLAGKAGRGVHRAAHAGGNDRGDALGPQPRAHPHHCRRSPASGLPTSPN